MADETTTVAEQQPRQTLSYLQKLFRERGIRPNNKLGQSFLIDINLVDLIERHAELTSEDLAIEIGSGTGSLTARLIEHAGAVLSVEIDPAFHSLVSELLGHRERLVLLHSDALKNKNHLHPRVLDSLTWLREKTGCQRLKLVANLPYAVATPVIANFLMSDFQFDRMVVTVQWEIGERLLALPGTKDFGALAVMVQSIADIELLRHLGRGVFFPRPKVESAILRIWPRADRRAALIKRFGNLQRVRHFLRDLYTQRRKNLRGALVALPSGRLGKEEVDRKLIELAIDGTTRAETLDVEQHLRLCEAFG
ncbi:MAG TPA: 16S rRNA (adenine(1518)-N(6)/adenine(1519)-N(6))-dimethyltransferase RsmA [Gemmataceae bacterium]|nr:16S rRNA (adenine(1518)-N(6)/adenine(1519)-N(6))-dimethyltransferase RsmA [Gemmataceae bacterium]